MDTILSHTTALEVLRSPLLGGRPPSCAPTRVPEHAPSTAELEVLLAEVSVLGACQLPLELLVSGENRSHSRLVRTHRTREALPASAFTELVPGLGYVSPEHLAVQLARELSDLELVCLVSELLGLYAIAPSDERGMVQRAEPLTTPERMVAHLDALSGYPGVGRVRAALGRACVGSGSPRETKLSLRLGLKPGLGGYHLNVLSMNEPLEVRRIGSRLGRGIRRPDILLMAPEGHGAVRGVAVEYDGSAHYDEARHARDVRRHNELTSLGLKEYVVAREQYASLDYMDGLVAAIRRDLGLPAIGITKAEAGRRRELRRRLYEELERIDGVTWGGRQRERLSACGCDDDVVPVEAYGV